MRSRHGPEQRHPGRGRRRRVAARLRTDLQERPLRAGRERLLRGQGEREPHAAGRMDQEGTADERSEEIRISMQQKKTQVERLHYPMSA